MSTCNSTYILNFREESQAEEEEEEFYMLRPVNKTDHMHQGMNVLA